MAGHDDFSRKGPFYWLHFESGSNERAQLFGAAVFIWSVHDPEKRELVSKKIMLNQRDEIMIRSNLVGT